MNRMNLQLVNALQHAYTAGIEYVTTLRYLSKLNLQGVALTQYDNDLLNNAYSRIKTAQWEVNAALDGGMTDSKS